MDSTIVSTISGIVGGVIGAIVGGFFALRAARKQIDVMVVQTHGSVHERLYNQNLEIMRFFAEYPELRAYFYDNKELMDTTPEKERLRALSAAEMVAGFMELVAIQMPDIDASAQPKWKSYIADEYNSSSVLRQHFHTNSGWYTNEILTLLPVLKELRR